LPSPPFQPGNAGFGHGIGLFVLQADQQRLADFAPQIKRLAGRSGAGQHPDFDLTLGEIGYGRMKAARWLSSGGIRTPAIWASVWLW